MDGDGEATKGHRDGDTKGHGWGNGDTGTQPGPEVAPWRDEGTFRTWMGMEGRKGTGRGAGMGTRRDTGMGT